MSTLVYAALTSAREIAPPPGARPMAPAPESNDGGGTPPPNIKTYVDAMAALVPAEVLALHAIMVSMTSAPSKDARGQPGFTITDPGALTLTFYVLFGLSIFLYVAGHLWTRGKTRLKWEWGLDTARALVPPAAFTIWTALQRGTAFDAAFPSGSGTGNTRILVGLVGAVVLGVVAAYLAKRADQQVDAPQNS